MLKSTPSRRKGCSHLFRDMWNEGEVVFNVRVLPNCKYGTFVNIRMTQQLSLDLVVNAMYFYIVIVFVLQAFSHMLTICFSLLH